MNPYRSPNPAPLLGVLLAVLGFGLGSALVASPALVLPLTLESVALALVSALMVTACQDPGLRSWLGWLVVVAIFIRYVALLLVHYYFPRNFFVIDSIGYERIGRQLSQYWQGVGSYPEIPGQGLLPSYYHLNGILDLTLGDPTMAAVVLNLFAGIWTTILIVILCEELFGPKVAKISGVLTAFFPSLILWSVLNIRDSLATFAVTLTVLFGLRTFRSPTPLRLLGLTTGLVLLTALRDYMGFLCLCGLALAAVAAVRPGRSTQTLVGGAVLIGFLSIAGSRLGLFPVEILDDPLASAQRMREGLQFGATSAFGTGADTRTLGGTLRYLPLGFAYLLFAPFPWAIETALQAAAAPEIVLWYPLFLLSLVGLRQRLVDGRNLDLFPLAVLLVVTTSYALVEGNFGTAYRHRAQIMPLFFAFASVGLISVWRGFRARKRPRKQMLPLRPVAGGTPSDLRRPRR